MQNDSGQPRDSDRPLNSAATPPRNAWKVLGVVFVLCPLVVLLAYLKYERRQRLWAPQPRAEADSPFAKQFGNLSKVTNGMTEQETLAIMSPRGRITRYFHDYLIGFKPKDAPQPLRTFQGHTKEVAGVVFNPDGKRLASAGYDGTVRIWDAASGAELHTLRHGHPYVGGVAFSPDAQWVASGGADQKVVLWDAATGRRIRTHDTGGGGESADSIAFSPDSKWLVAAGELVPAGFDETIHIWDVATGKPRPPFKGHVNGIFSIAFHPDGKLLASAGSQDGVIIFWEFATGRQLKTLDPKSGRIWDMAFSPGFETLASGDEEGMIRIWDVATGKELRKFRGNAKEIMNVAFRKDGKLLAAAGRDGSVSLWDPASGKQLRSFQAHTGRVRHVVFHPNGKQLATSGADHTVKLWEVSEP